MCGRNVDAGGDSGVKLSVNLSQSDLASLVGVSRQYRNELISRRNEQELLTWKGNAPPVLIYRPVEDAADAAGRLDARVRRLDL